jgi:ABC-type cobalamin/Fe3+-siderophores transport system ATPase subunit
MKGATTMYTGLLTQLEALRQRTARFRRVTLHLHSPDSHDWAKCVGDKAKNDRVKFIDSSGAELFLKELQPHFDLVSITDHMKCGYACQLSSTSSKYRDCVVLPGMEVNFRPDAALGIIRIHLIVILPENSTKESFAKLFHSQSFPPDDNCTGQEEVVGMTLKEFVKEVENQKGICIAAHVDNKQGIRCRFRQTAVETIKMFSEGNGAELEKEHDIADSLREFIFGSGVHAVEIHTLATADHYRWISNIDNKEKWIPTILTSDAHCIEDFTKLDRVTHIKMTDLSIQGLKDALSFPETRIRFPKNLPELPNPRLLGIQISGNQDSFFEDVTVAFAENLNCLIGVRGSGKSTVVEALRYAFGYNNTLSELKSLESSIREMQIANLSGSTIKVVYRTKSGEERILQATYDKKEDYTTKVYSNTGEFIDVPNVEASGDYPLRLYGWSEIETLGRDPSRQRDLLDRLIPDIFPIIKRRLSIRDELHSNRSVINRCIEDVKTAFVANDNQIRRYNEYKTDFEKLNTNDVKTIFSALDIANQKNKLLKLLKSNAESLVTELGKIGTVSLKSDLNELLESGTQELRDWWHVVESKRLNIVSTEQDIQKQIVQAIESLKSFISLCAEHAKESDDNIGILEHELRDKFSQDDSMQKIADLRANADRRLKAVTTLRQNYLKQWNSLFEALKRREEITSQLEQVQNEIIGIRSKTNTHIAAILNEFLPMEMKVTIDFQVGRDTAEFSKKLYAIFGAKGNQPKKITKIIETHCTPISFAGMMGQNDFKTLIGKTIKEESGTLEFNVEDAELCKTRTAVVEKDTSADVMTLAENGKRLETILDVQEAKWDDHETILLNGVPVNEKSPGQRSSAMLPLIALAENSPLIIDQPEDNLDKRLIGTVLQKVLAKLKENRQIIVCTHDPNILVGGDAEQVVVLEAKSDRKGKVAMHGSIDNDNIVSSVIELLEGGSEAFKSRRKRYRDRA